MKQLLESELILNPDGSIYHLKLRPEQIASTIITVGDQDRVAEVSKYFDAIDHKVEKREFVTHTGWLRGKRLSVISTGIGTDNIDIVFNELDALFNIDFETRQVKETITPLTFIRIGTSGCLQEDIPLDAFLISTYGLGLDNLLHFYENDAELTNSNIDLSDLTKSLQINPYLFKADEDLVAHFTERAKQKIHKGITVTCPGFYAPQGRSLRIKALNKNLIQQLQKIDIEGNRITNMEMETAGIYGMASLLGHKAISFNALLANRVTGSFSTQPKQTVDRLIRFVLDGIE